MITPLVLTDQHKKRLTVLCKNLFPEYKYIYWCFNNTSLHFYGAEDKTDFKIPWQEILFYWIPRMMEIYLGHKKTLDEIFNFIESNLTWYHSVLLRNKIG